MEHTLYILEKERDGGIKDLILGLAKHLDATTQIRDVLVVETDDARLAGMARTLAESNGELLHLANEQDQRHPFDLLTRELVEDAWLGEDRLPDGPAIEAIEKGEGRLLILTNEDHAETHDQTPATETVVEETPVKPKRQLTFKPRHCEICDQEYTPTGARQVGHKDCPGKKNGAQPEPDLPEEKQPKSAAAQLRDLSPDKFLFPAGGFIPEDPDGNALPPWVDLKTATCYENTELQRLVKEGEFEAGRRFGHREIGVHVVVNRGLEFFLEPVKKTVPAGDRE
jgi:hypothetical protein